MKHTLNLLAALLLAPFCLCAGDASTSAKPNILFILADDLGQMDIGAFNPKTFYETPNIDALAKRGMKFTQGYAACCVCSPTRGSIMTGKYPPRFGITNFIPGGRAGKLNPAPNAGHLPLEEVTIAESLRDAGYATFFAGKWHLGGAGFLPKDQGFTAEPKWRHRAEARGEVARAEGRCRRVDPKSDPKRTDRIAQEAVQVHRAKQGPAPSSPICHSTRCTCPSVHARIWWRSTQEKAEASARRRLGQERANQVRLVQNNPVYAAMLEQFDAGIGRVLAALEQQWPHRENHRRLHVRQRRTRHGGRASDLEPAAARRQRLALRRRRARADDCRRARRDEARHDLRFAGHQHGFLSHAAPTRGPAVASPSSISTA